MYSTKEIFEFIFINYLTASISLIYGTIRLIRYFKNGVDIPENDFLQVDFQGLLVSIGTFCWGLLILVLLIFDKV